MNIVQMLAVLAADSGLPGEPPIYHRRFGQATQTKKLRRVSPHNHNKGTTKKERKTAAKSNQINRLRINHWKH